MIKYAINEIVEAVERESYSLFNLEFIETKNRSDKNLLLKRIGYMCDEKEMIGYECNNRSYR